MMNSQSPGRDRGLIYGEMSLCHDNQEGDVIEQSPSDDSIGVPDQTAIMNHLNSLDDSGFQSNRGIEPAYADPGHEYANENRYTASFFQYHPDSYGHMMPNFMPIPRPHFEPTGHILQPVQIGQNLNRNIKSKTFSTEVAIEAGSSSFSPPSTSPASPGPLPDNFDPAVDGTSTHPILHKISKYSLTSASTGINFYFRIYKRYYKARRDSFSKDKTMMYLRCNTCPKEPCKWRAKIRLIKPNLYIDDPQYMCIDNYQVLSNSKAHHHHQACRSLSLADTDFD